jgi:ribonuclease D
MLPGNSTDLEKIPELSMSDYRRWGSAILAGVKAGAKQATQYQPLAESVRPSMEQKRVERLLWEHLKVACKGADIPTAAVAAREDIRKLLRGEQNLRLLYGWRREFAGRDLQKLAADKGIGYTC